MDTRSSDRAPPPPSSSSPVKVSVVTTLLYPRERPLECLRSWTYGQNFPPDAIEMIVVINGRRRRWEDRLPRVLRPGDRALFCDETNEMALYDAGIRAARGEWIVMTEPHVTAEPDCIRQLLEYVNAGGLAGACVRTMPSSDRSPIARMEARMYLESAAEWSRTGQWRMITKRGVMLRKDAYLAVGGFDTDQLRFAETTLAAKLHRAGYRIGYAEVARIHHQNSTRLEELLRYVWEYRAQELRVLREQPGLLGEELSSSFAFSGDPGLSGLATASPGVRQAVLRTIWCVVAGANLGTNAGMGMWPLHWSLLRAGLRLAIGPRLGHIAALAGALGGFIRAWCAFHLAGKNDGKRYAAYRNLWQTFGDLSVATLALDPVETAAGAGVEARVPGAGGVCIAGLRPGEAAGFHGLETLGGVPFRWTSAIAVVRISGPDGDSAPVESVTWEILGARPLEPDAVYLYHAGRRFEAEEASSAPGRKTWVFKSGNPPANGGLTGAGYLVLICPPWLVPGSADSRVLGLPVVEVSWRRCSAAS